MENLQTEIIVRSPTGQAEIYYPDSDRRPMADNDLQYYTMTDTRFALEQRFINNPDVQVGADLLVYYQEGNTRSRFAPDVFVVFGVAKGMRRSYKVWEEGKVPDLIFEIASESTWREDIGKKYKLYQKLGIQEYFLFDPSGRYFHPPLKGYRLWKGTYQPLPELTEKLGKIGYYSQILNLELWMRENSADKTAEMPYLLRLYDPVSGVWLRTPAEEAEARRNAEAEIQKLRAELKSGK